MTESSSRHITILSQFIHLDHFYNWCDLALRVEMIISISVPFGDTLYHLVTPCIIRMYFMFACLKQFHIVYNNGLCHVHIHWVKHRQQTYRRFFTERFAVFYKSTHQRKPFAFQHRISQDIYMHIYMYIYIYMTMFLNKNING